MAREITPLRVAALIDELLTRGLELPDEAVHGRRLLDCLDAGRVTRAPTLDLSNLQALTPVNLTHHVQRAALLEMAEITVKTRAGHLATNMAKQIASVMRRELDALLDQLRPAFDDAADTVHQAVEAGIREGERADQVILLSDPAVQAWRGLPGPMGVLQDIADVRLQLIDVLDAEPTQSAAYAACFTTVDTPWNLGNGTEWDRWLRVTTAAAQPLHLMTADETHANAQRMQAAHRAGDSGEPTPVYPRPDADRLPPLFPAPTQ